MAGIPIDKNAFVFTYPVFFLLNPAPPVSFVKHPAQNRATFAAMLGILAEQNRFTHLIIDARGAGVRLRRCVAIKDLVDYFRRGGK